ncbi:transposase [Candidatus Magnetomorum sp. HK-1]|nr:transposase [Candidatus Magnetomorum sp. HK-1]
MKIEDQRISGVHLSRKAIIYIRQSSSQQVKTHKESIKMQLSLKERAIDYGWQNPTVIDDLGISATGFADRPGFQRLLTMVTMKEAGIVFSLDASRLSRNSKDWAQLFELCSFFDTLIADHEQIYNLNNPSDRLLIGVKGSMSEMELSTIKLRLKEGAVQKAKRGELKITLPPGYIYDLNNKVVTDPDQRVREAVTQMFCLFKKHTSIRQLAKYYYENEITFPVRTIQAGKPLIWKIPNYAQISYVLHNPTYAGIYAYGKKKTVSVYKDGKLIKKRVKVDSFEECQVFIKDNHDGYIKWEDFLDNQEKISQNGARWKMKDNLCSIREGLALLSGLLRCGHCGKRLYVSYNNSKESRASYYCKVDTLANIPGCLRFGSKFVDKCITGELLKTLKPAAVESGIEAIKLSESKNQEQIKIAQLELENAKYQSQRAFDQYNQVDPNNRLVASTLESRFNDSLLKVKKAEERLLTLKKSIRKLTDEEKSYIHHLSQNFDEVWEHEKTEVVLKKQLLRLFIKEIIVKHDKKLNMLNLVIHWQGGVHTEVSLKKPVSKPGKKTGESLIEVVKKLSTRLDDGQIARVLNMNELFSAHGLRWNQDRVLNFRRTHHIKLTYQKDSNKLTSRQAIKYLGIGKSKFYKLVDSGIIKAHQIMPYAPHEIPIDELNSEKVQKAIKKLKSSEEITSHSSNEKNQKELPFNFSKEPKNNY